MVYVPLETVKRLVIKRWRAALSTNPSTPKPTWWDVKLEWFRMLDYVPQNDRDFDNFLIQFPSEDQKEIIQKNRKGWQLKTVAIDEYYRGRLRRNEQ